MKGIILTSEGKRTEFNIEAIKLEKRKAEKIFNINLKDRIFSVTKSLGWVEIIFFDKDNCFGWLEKLTERDFNKRLECPTQ